MELSICRTMPCILWKFSSVESCCIMHALWLEITSLLPHALRAINLWALLIAYDHRHDPIHPFRYWSTSHESWLSRPCIDSTMSCLWGLCSLCVWVKFVWFEFESEAWKRNTRDVWGIFADFECIGRDDANTQDQTGLSDGTSSPRIRPGLVRLSRRLQNEAGASILGLQHPNKSHAEAPVRATPSVSPSQVPSTGLAPGPGRLDQKADVNNTEGPAPSFLPLQAKPFSAPSVCKRPYKLSNSGLLRLLASFLLTSECTSEHMTITSRSCCKGIIASCSLHLASASQNLHSHMCANLVGQPIYIHRLSQSS